MKDLKEPLKLAVEAMALLERSQKLGVSLQAKNMAKATGKEFSISDWKTVSDAFLKSSLYMASRPGDLMQFQMELATGLWKAWSGFFTEDDGPAPDRRYMGKEWSSDPLGRVARDAHLALETSMHNLLATLPKGSKEHLRADFYTRQILSATAPPNFLGLNPVAKKHFVESNGQSLLNGFRNLLDDLERGDGRIDLSTNDPQAFTVGKDLATTPGKVIHQNKLMQLIQYEPQTKTQHARPFLFVPAWINKYYILDMRARNSLVRYMVERGHTVFVISWANPTKEHADLSFEDYMKLGPLEALDVMRDITDEDTANILGFCIGGILVTATLAYLTAKGEGKRVRSATTLATLIDFTEVGEIGVFIDRERIDVLRTHMQDKGFLEKHHLQEMFSMIRENDLVWSFHVLNYLIGKKPPAFDLLFWNADSTRLPAEMLLWYLEKIYIENGLRQPGFLSLDGVPIDIGKIETPCFVLATREDHISPWRSVYPSTQLLGGDVTFVLGGSGHIAGVINPPTKAQKYGYWISSDYPDAPDEWLAGAEHTAGSWWPAWAKWVEAKDRRKRVPARVPGADGRAIIEDAPGSFVQAR